MADKKATSSLPEGSVAGVSPAERRGLGQRPIEKKGKTEKRVEHITDMNEDFAQWYTDIVRKAELAEYSEVGGCVIFQPYGYAIWERIQQV